MNRASTSLRLASVFSDHAVLQRDQPIPVWGTAAPGETVVVRLADREASVLAGPDGHWLVRLPPLPAGGPHSLLVASASEQIGREDVLVGEVWICSGQSNMEWTLGQTGEATDETDSDLPDVRLLTVRTGAGLVRQTIFDDVWQRASWATLNDFSAVGGWFGRAVRRALGVPVGLICNAWGGTRIQAWMSREALMCDPHGLDEVRAYEGHAYATAGPGKTLTFVEWEQQMRARDARNRGLAEGWAAPGFDDAAWAAMPLPLRWQEHGHPGSGVFWFRRQVALPEAWRGRELTLGLGAIDKHDDTYVEGERVGGLSWEDGENTWSTPRVYRVPPHLTRAGRLQIAVRVRSHVYHGGLIGPPSQMRLTTDDDWDAPISLAGPWRYQVEQDWGLLNPPGMTLGPGNANAPYTLFDGRVAPLIPYGVRGVIWYQGESNAAEAGLYRVLLPQMIDDWRRAFGQGDLPFLQVQLANYQPPAEHPGRSDWAELRDAQAAALTDPRVGLAAAIDLGEAGDIHPRRKRAVGERLARWALVRAYGQTGDPAGPMYAGMTIEPGGKARMRFHHGGGLRTSDGAAPRQVAIAGGDRAFVWARAAIEGDTLVAWHPDVPRPAAVRYAWADNPADCNLVGGSEGLPAFPFRSDRW